MSDKEEKCTPCDVAAAAKSLVAAHCSDKCSDDSCVDSCNSHLQNMLDNNQNLAQLGKAVNAPAEDIDYFKEQGVDVNTGLKDLLEKE